MPPSIRCIYPLVPNCTVRARRSPPRAPEPSPPEEAAPRQHPMVEGAELPDFVHRMIYGEITLEEKRAALDTSTRNWWREYAARKNDEEEEHVADTLLYDERCHLPRMAPRPDVVVDDAFAGGGRGVSSSTSVPVDAATVPSGAAGAVAPP